jgi:hypothetical protein
MAHLPSKVLLASATDKDPRLLLAVFRIEKGNLAVFR